MLRLDTDTRAALDYARSGSVVALLTFDRLGLACTLEGEGPHVGLSRSVDDDERRERRRKLPPAPSVGMLAVAYRLANLTDEERLKLARALRAHAKRMQRASDPQHTRDLNAKHARAYRARKSLSPNP